MLVFLWLEMNPFLLTLHLIDQVAQMFSQRTDDSVQAQNQAIVLID